MVLIKTNEYGHINVGDVYPTKKKSKMDVFIQFYTGIKWTLFRNDYYEDAINGEFPNEFYKYKQNVPVYRTYKDGVKIGRLYPRETENGFKFIVSIHEKRNAKTLKKYNQYYYISTGFDEDYNIIMPTELTRSTKNNFNQYEGY
jgi:hypothetical protein|tara:strand:- start:184 stop:615 length:432 start_codon:yes stop_codon:yes gene_type:complete